MGILIWSYSLMLHINHLALTPPQASFDDFILHTVFNKPCEMGADGKKLVRDRAVSMLDIRFCPSDFPYAVCAGC